MAEKTMDGSMIVIEGMRITAERKAYMRNQNHLDMSASMACTALLQALLLYRAHDNKELARVTRQLAYRAARLFYNMPPRPDAEWLAAVRLAAACCAACIVDTVWVEVQYFDEPCMDLLRELARGDAYGVTSTWLSLGANSRRIFTELAIDPSRRMR